MDNMGKRTFLGDAYIENLKNILKEGVETSPRGNKITEIIGTSIEGDMDNLGNLLSIKGIRDLDSTSDSLSSAAKYLIAELFWYFSGSEGSEFIQFYGDIWKNIKNTDGTLNSNYGRSVFYTKVSSGSNLTRYDWILNALKQDPDTRQAIIHYTDNRIFNKDFGKDFTCTQLQHFFLRNGCLYSIVYIRSSDAIYGLNFDIPFWTLVHLKMLSDLNSSKIFKEPIRMGTIKINFGSSHIYEKHYELCRNIVDFWNKNRDNHNKYFKRLDFKTCPSTNYALDQELTELLHTAANLAYTHINNTREEDSDFSFQFMFNMKSVLDGEKKYPDLLGSPFYYAKKLMQVFRLVYFEKITDTKKLQDFNSEWFDCVVKKWFNCIFKISDVK